MDLEFVVDLGSNSLRLTLTAPANFNGLRWRSFNELWRCYDTRHTLQRKREIAKALHTYLKTNESDAMAKVHGVIELLTAKACLSRGLAKHFDDEDSMPKEGCGRCSFCLSGKSIPLHQTDTHSRKGRIDKTKSGAILAATKVRNDARFLARIAFGIRIGTLIHFTFIFSSIVRELTKTPLWVSACDNIKVCSVQVYKLPQF